jgi:hypothetical protein
MVRNEWTNGNGTKNPDMSGLFCFPDFVCSGGWHVMREPLVRVILRYFEIFRVNLSSAFTIHHFHHVKRGKQFTIISTPPPIPVKANKGE